ncbi:MAG: 50S ribosomal protein L22 [Patescibacteria group bacterium]
MKAYLRSVRIAPKKANLIARMVRGMAVPAAVTALERTNKKAARMIEKLLKSAMANASHNEKQDPEQMVIASIVVNQGQAYRRGMPKARGQTRPYKKFLSHIALVLGYPSEGKNPRHPKKPRKPKNDEQQAKVSEKASQETKKPVQGTRSKTKMSEASSDSSVSPAPRSPEGEGGSVSWVSSK